MNSPDAPDDESSDFRSGASPAPPIQRATPDESADYLAVGNPTLDVRSGPAGAPAFTVGGTVVYAAVQAARLGLTAAVAGRLAAVDRPAVRWACGPGVMLRLQPAEATTVFDNSVGQPRVQHLRSWAGAVDLDDLPGRCRILHVGPVAREVDLSAAGAVSAEFVGITPQGALRHWDAAGRVTHRVIEFVPGVRADAVVLSYDELPFARALVDDVVARGGVVVATKGAVGCTVLSGSGAEEYEAFAVAVTDDTGAGDVFSAAFFVEYSRGAGVSRAVRFASAAAALSIQGDGVSAVADRDRIEQFGSERTPPGILLAGRQLREL